MGRRHSIYLCEVVIDNCFSGRRFILRNADEVAAFGLSVPSVKTKSREKDSNILHGIRFTAVNSGKFNEKWATQEGYGYDWQDISNVFMSHPSRFKHRGKPVIGKVIEGEHRGEHIALFSLSTVAPYFPVESVRRAIIEQVDYCGMRWYYAGSHKEAEERYQGEERQKEIFLSLNLYRPRKQGWRVAGWKHAAGYHKTLDLLVDAEKALAAGESMDGLVFLHKALGAYQSLPRRKMESSLIAELFIELGTLLTPKADMSMLDIAIDESTQHLIKRMISLIKHKE